MTIRKIDEVLGAQAKPITVLPNVSVEKLGGGFGKSEAPLKMIKNSICSVLKAFANLESTSSIQATRSQIQLDAEKLKLSSSEYLVMLAMEHEKNQDHPSIDINIVIVRFITHLMKIRGDHSDLIHDLQEVRENLNRLEDPEMRFSRSDLERQVILSRLKSIFH